jgi:hypothetical protein
VPKGGTTDCLTLRTTPFVSVAVAADLTLLFPEA